VETNLVYCSCGKQIEKIPLWLSDAKVEFVCINCPNRTVKTISQVASEQLASYTVEASGEEIADSVDLSSDIDDEFDI